MQASMIFDYQSTKQKDTSPTRCKTTPQADFLPYFFGFAPETRLLSLQLETLAGNLYAAVFYGTPSLVLALLFRWLAVKEDRKAEEQARAELERKQARRAGMTVTPRPT